MKLNCVVVHRVDELEAFADSLQQNREDLEALYAELLRSTNQQSENWQDPQYDHLKQLVEEYYEKSERQLLELDQSISYIQKLIEKLKN